MTALVQDGDKGSRAFADCDLLESVVIGAGMKNIPKNTFEGSMGLHNLTIEIATDVTFHAESMSRCPNLVISNDQRNPATLRPCYYTGNRVFINPPLFSYDIYTSITFTTTVGGTTYSEGQRKTLLQAVGGGQACDHLLLHYDYNRFCYYPGVRCDVVGAA